MRGMVGYLGPLPPTATAAGAVWDFAPGGLERAASGADRDKLLGASSICVL
jgi:hypothetical protein